MADEEVIECIENSHVRAFLQEHLEGYACDVLIFSEQILAHVPSQSKSFVKSAGLAFYSTPMISFVPDLPWQTIKSAIAKAVSEAFQGQIRNDGRPEKRMPGFLDQNHMDVELIKQAIVAAFASVCKTAEDAMGAILIGGLAHLLGKYIALYTAGIIDEVIELKSWPVVQAPSTDPA